MTMTQPVYYVELNSPDPKQTKDFFAEVFGWDPQPFATADYLVAPAGEASGVDSAILPSRDGVPRVVPVIRVDSIDAAIVSSTAAGGTTVVDIFVIAGVGRGCYITDPTGLLIGLHEYDSSA
jgi:predicted enzyme related to lactoylglutathione lyase